MEIYVMTGPFDPSWSPDGERIAFASDRKGDFENFEIYVIDADGSNQQKLTENRVYDWSPSWSPDGELLGLPSCLRGMGISVDSNLRDGRRWEESAKPHQ